MCHQPGSIPPLPWDCGPVRSQGALTLSAADGNQVQAWLAEPETPNGQAVVVLPDVRGLHHYYRELAAGFAGIGVRAVAMDYFGRTAGPGERPDDFEWLAHVRALTPEQVRTDVAAVVDFLRSPGEGGPVPDLFTVGFCLGGGHSWRQAATGTDISGAIGFYGRPSVAQDVADRMTAPVLMLMGGDDPHIPREEGEAFHDLLVRSGADAEIVVYDGAPHSFFDRDFGQFGAVCEDAWKQIRAFMNAHSRPGGGA
jgi:carboxymethylenebutenolidase